MWWDESGWMSEGTLEVTKHLETLSKTNRAFSGTLE